MAGGQPPPSSVRTERLLRAACAAMAAAGALLLGFSAQTKTVFFVQKKAVPKDVQALWYVRSLLCSPSYHARLARSLEARRLMSLRVPACQGADRGGRGRGGVPRRPARLVPLHGPPRQQRRLPASRESGRVRLLPPRQGTCHVSSLDATHTLLLLALDFAGHRSRSPCAVPQPFPFTPVALALA